MHDIFNLSQTPKPNSDPKEELTVEEQFEGSRKDWLNTVRSMAEKLRGINQLADVQVELYSNRQVVLEHNHYLMSLFSKVNGKYKLKRKERYDHYYKNSDVRLNKGEIEDLVNGDTYTQKEKVEMFEHQIEYFRETIKTIDNMIYGVKSRIDFEKFKNGIS